MTMTDTTPPFVEIWYIARSTKVLNEAEFRRSDSAD